MCAKIAQKKENNCRSGRLPSAEPPNCFSLSSYVRNYTTLSSGIIFADEKLICPSCASTGGRSASGWAGSAVCGGRATNWHNVARLAKKKPKQKTSVGEKLLVFTDGGAYELAKIPSSLWSELQQKTAEVAFISQHSNKALSPHWPLTECAASVEEMSPAAELSIIAGAYITLFFLLRLQNSPYVQGKKNHQAF